MREGCVRCVLVGIAVKMKVGERSGRRVDDTVRMYFHLEFFY